MQPRVFSIEVGGQTISGGATAFFREDVEKIRLRFVNNGQPIDYSGASVRMGIGSIGSPTAGGYKISDAVGTSAVVSFSATAAQVKTALDALRSNTGLFAAGPCAVTGAMPRYTVTVGSNNTGSVSNLSASDITLSPDADVRFLERQSASSTRPLVFDIVFPRKPAVLQTSWSSVSTSITPTVSTIAAGGSGSNEVQLISIPTIPDEGSFAITMPARSVTVSSVSSSVFTSVNHGLYDGQSVTLSAFTISSGFSNGAQYIVTSRTKDTFRIASTAGGAPLTVSASSGGTAQLASTLVGPIAYNASASAVSSAFVAAGFTIGGTQQIVCTATPGREYRLIFGGGSANIDFAPVTIISDLKSLPAIEANVSFNTFGVRDAVERGDNSLFMEVEVAQGGVRKTYRTGASFSADLLASSVSSPVVVPFNGSITLQSSDSSLWSITVDNDGILTATKQ
jgi:hypothetical protein